MVDTEYDNHGWLAALKLALSEMNKVEENLYRSKRELRRWVEGDLSTVKLTAESDGAQLEEIIEQLKYKLIEKQIIVDNINFWLKYFGKDLSNQVLYMKHIKGYTLNKIAIELGYTASYIGKVHADAMRLIKEMNKAN